MWLCSECNDLCRAAKKSLYYRECRVCTLRVVLKNHSRTKRNGEKLRRTENRYQSSDVKVAQIAFLSLLWIVTCKGSNKHSKTWGWKRCFFWRFRITHSCFSFSNLQQVNTLKRSNPQMARTKACRFHYLCLYQFWHWFYSKPLVNLLEVRRRRCRRPSFDFSLIIILFYFFVRKGSS